MEAEVVQAVAACDPHDLSPLRPFRIGVTGFREGRTLQVATKKHLLAVDQQLAPARLEAAKAEGLLPRVEQFATRRAKLSRERVQRG